MATKKKTTEQKDGEIPSPAGIERFAVVMTKTQAEKYTLLSTHDFRHFLYRVDAILAGDPNIKDTVKVEFVRVP